MSSTWRRAVIASLLPLRTAALLLLFAGAEANSLLDHLEAKLDPYTDDGLVGAKQHEIRRIEA